MRPDEFLNQPIVTINNSTLKENIELPSQNDAILKNNPFESVLSLGKNSMLSKNPGENYFFKALLSNNKTFLNTESAQIPAYTPLTNEKFFPDDQLKELDSKNTSREQTNMNKKSLNFNEFMQLFTSKNNGGDDCMRFLNLNSSKIRAEGNLILPQILSHNAESSHLNNELEKEEQKKKEQENKEKEKEEEGDIIKKMIKIE